MPCLPETAQATNMTLKELRTQLDTKKISATELAEQYLNRIETADKEVNAFITVTPELAREQAAHAQALIDEGDGGPLTGIPYAAKDLFCTQGIQTTAGSRILEGYLPPYSATAIEKCRGGVLLGKTNLDEFAMGSSTEHSAYGPTKNPYDLTRVPGGSSGGSAAAVAADMTPFAFGTDTGGSIRQPASFCNVVGFKPTYGRISRYGVIAMSSSLDTVGFFTRTVEDSAYLLEQLAGHDPLDTTTPNVPLDAYMQATTQDIKGMKIGIPKEYLALEGLDPKIKTVFDQSVEKIQELGASIVEVSLPHTKYALAAYYILCPSEVSSNLARYDGMQYGKHSANAQSLEEVFMKTRDESLGAEAKRRIIIGTFCLSAGYVDAYYKKAQRVRTLVRQDFDTAFEQVDMLLTPTSPTLPFTLGDRTSDPLAMYMADIFTIPSSLAGIPGMSLPAGAVDGLPVAVQLLAPQFKETTLLNAAARIEEATSIDGLTLKI